MRKEEKYTFIRPVMINGFEKWVAYQGNICVGEIIAQINDEQKNVTVKILSVRDKWKNRGIEAGLVKRLAMIVPLDYSLVFSPEVVYQIRL